MRFWLAHMLFAALRRPQVPGLRAGCAEPRQGPQVEEIISNFYGAPFRQEKVMISPTGGGCWCGLHSPRSKQKIHLSVVYRVGAPRRSARQQAGGVPRTAGSLRGHARPLCAAVASSRVGLHTEAVICPFLPELLPLIPHQDILRPGRND